MSTNQDVLKKIAENEVKFVDYRFTDTIGQEQHVSVPVSQMNEDEAQPEPDARRHQRRVHAPSLRRSGKAKGKGQAWTLRGPLGRYRPNYGKGIGRAMRKGIGGPGGRA